MMVYSIILIFLSVLIAKSSSTIWDEAYREESLQFLINQLDTLEILEKFHNLKMKIVSDLAVKNREAESSSSCRSYNSHGVGIDKDPQEKSNEHTSKATVYPKSCQEVLHSGKTQSGIYVIQPKLSKKPFEVLCDMDLDDGGWTHIQKRVDGRTDFYRSWRDYRFGFGHLDDDQEFWMGLENIYLLTASQVHELLVEIIDREGKKVYAKYTNFAIGREEDGYPLKALGNHSGDAEDALSYHLGMKFSTFDLDQDKHSATNCAEYYKGAWWYNTCYYSNLNGKYINLDVDARRGIMTWNKQDYCLAKARMLIRPASF